MRVFINVAMSADGKIGLPDRSHASFGSAEDKRRMSLYRRQADAVLVGGATFRAWPHAMVEDPRHLHDRAVPVGGTPTPPGREAPLLNVVLTRSLDLPEGAPAFSDPRVRMLVIVEGEAPAAPPWGDRVTVVALPRASAEAVTEVLAGLGVRALLVEGGGEVTSLFLRAGLVDELYVTVAPLVLGGRDSPTPVGGAAFTFASAPRLALVEATVKGDELFLAYRVAPGSFSSAAIQSPPK